MGGVCWYPAVCGNCGCPGPYVMEGTSSLFWLCEKCAEKWAPMATLMILPDEVEWEMNLEPLKGDQNAVCV